MAAPAALLSRLVSLILLLSPLVAPAQGSAAPAASPGAAQWLSETVFVASSLEAGHVGYLEAWGGSEFGYAYTYTLSGQPPGVTVDADSGELSLGQPLPPRSYNFKAIVRNRKDTSKTSSFAVSLRVLRGVTSRRIGSDILHKTYIVDSGTYGVPDKSDYTGVLMNIRRAILADQAAAGDGNVRAAIVFRGGRTYGYTNNRWTFGIQYLTIASDRPGLRASLRNTAMDAGADVSLVILQIGRQYFQCVIATGHRWVCDIGKAAGYEVAPTRAGSHQVTVKDAAASSQLKAGRHVLIGSYDQQLGGFPPNIRYFDYARIAAISDGTITLDRPLRFGHRDDYWENGDPNSLGVARIYPIDRDDERLTLRATIKDIEFLANPNNNGNGDGTKVFAAALDTEFDNCVIPHLMASQARFVRVEGGSVHEGELDKLVSMILFDRAAVAGLHEATGVNYLLFKNSRITSGYGLAPRQIRILNSTLDGTSHAPLSFKGEWTTQQIDVRNSQFNGSGPAFSEWPAQTLKIGDGVTWDGRDLTVAAEHSSGYVGWLRAAWEGAIVYADTVRSDRWGILTKISGRESHIKFAMDWKGGPPPETGTTLLIPRLHDLSVDAASRAQGVNWNATGAARQVTPADSRQFPSGYPAGKFGF